MTLRPVDSDGGSGGRRPPLRLVVDNGRREQALPVLRLVPPPEPEPDRAA